MGRRIAATAGGLASHPCDRHVVPIACGDPKGEAFQEATSASLEVFRGAEGHGKALLTHDTARLVLDAESLSLTYQQQQVLSLSTAMGV